MNDLPSIILVTGTDTDVGKTITTAALAAALSAHGRTVAVYKPTQAGTTDGQGDIDVVRRLAGLDDVHEGIRLPDPMAPVAAAARAGVPLPTARDHTATIAQLAATHHHTFVEGAGGLLVALDKEGHTIADIATQTRTPCTVVVVCRSGLGTLNHTELTLEALRQRHVAIAGIVIGSWPRHPSEIDISNRQYFLHHRVPLIGVIPTGAASLCPVKFRASAPDWFNTGLWKALHDPA